MLASLREGYEIPARDVGLAFVDELLKFAGGEVIVAIVLHQTGDAGGQNLVDGFVATSLDLVFNEFFQLGFEREIHGVHP